MHLALGVMEKGEAQEVGGGPVQIMNMHGLPGHEYANKHSHTPSLDLGTPLLLKGHGQMSPGPSQVWPSQVPKAIA